MPVSTVDAESATVMALLGPLARYVPHSSFTKVQARSIPTLFERDENVLVAAPTGSGKTLLLEVAMLRLFRDRLLSATDSTNQQRDTPKAVYVCPIKALASEKYTSWSTMFRPLTVAIETGDQERSHTDDMNLQSITTADIIITTPERWDSITRRWKERTVLGLVNSVGLLLLDEIHTVSEERGAVLEALVSRMKAIKAAAAAQTRHALSGSDVADRQSSLRFVAISGTLPNMNDVGEWLEVPAAMRLSFSDCDRPVPLTTNVMGFSSDSHNPFVFDRFLTFKLFGLIRDYGAGKPAIVFCASRKETVTAAQRLVEEVRQAAARGGFERQLEPSADLAERVSAVSDKQLRGCLLIGIAFHHAALSLHDRQLVEQLFREQFISAVCTTTTLALGVNLPAHLVIVKGTTFFKAGTREDIPLSEVAQMCGRAGRPGLDTHGVALILTTHDKVSKYDRLRAGDAFTTIESHLHQHMIEHVNAEVALRTIHSFDSAVNWVKTSFFWIRLRRNPTHYGLRFDTKQAGDAFDPNAFVAALVRRVLEALQQEGCVAGLPPAECQLEPDLDPLSRLEITGVGRAMSRLYILFDTVKTYNRFVQKRCRGSREVDDKDGEEEDGTATAGVDGEEDCDNRGADVEPGASAGDVASTDGTANQAGTAARGPQRVPHTRQTTLGGGSSAVFDFSYVLTLFAHSREFVDVRLRQGDRGHLNQLNKDVKYPLKSGKRGGREVREDWHKAFVLIQAPLSQLPLTDMSLRNDSIRLWSAVPRVARFLCEYSWLSLSYSFALNADSLLRCVEHKVWPDGLLLRQLPTITETVARALAKAGLRQFSSLQDVDPRRVEVLCGRLPPFGNQLKALVTAVPRPSVVVQQGGSASGKGNAEQVSGLRSTAPGVLFTIQVRVVCQTEGHVESNADAVQGSGAGTGISSSNSSNGKRAKVGASTTQRPFLLLVGHRESDTILLKRYIPLASERDAQHPTSAPPCAATFEIRVPPSIPPQTVTVHVITPDLVGNDLVVPLFERASSLESTEPNDAVVPRKQPPKRLVPAVATTTVPRKRPRLSASPSPPESVPADEAAHPGPDSPLPQQEAAVASAAVVAVQRCATLDSAAVAKEARDAYDALLSDLQYVETPAASTKRQRTTAQCSPAAPSNIVTCAAHETVATTPARPATLTFEETPTAAAWTPHSKSTVSSSSGRASWPCAALPPPPRLVMPVFTTTTTTTTTDARPVTFLHRRTSDTSASVVLPEQTMSSQIPGAPLPQPSARFQFRVATAPPPLNGTASYLRHPLPSLNPNAYPVPQWSPVDERAPAVAQQWPHRTPERQCEVPPYVPQVVAPPMYVDNRGDAAVCGSRTYYATDPALHGYPNQHAQSPQCIPYGGPNHYGALVCNPYFDGQWATHHTSMYDTSAQTVHTPRAVRRDPFHAYPTSNSLPYASSEWTHLASRHSAIPKSWW